MKKSGRVGANAHGHNHIPQLADCGIGQYAFNIVLRNGDGSGKNSSKTAYVSHNQHGVQTEHKAESGH